MALAAAAFAAKEVEGGGYLEATPIKISHQTFRTPPQTSTPPPPTTTPPPATAAPLLAAVISLRLSEGLLAIVIDGFKMCDTCD